MRESLASRERLSSGPGLQAGVPGGLRRPVARCARAYCRWSRSALRAPHSAFALQALVQLHILSAVLTGYHLLPSFLLPPSVPLTPLRGFKAKEASPETLEGGGEELILQKNLRHT